MEPFASWELYPCRVYGHPEHRPPTDHLVLGKRVCQGCEDEENEERERQKRMDKRDKAKPDDKAEAKKEDRKAEDPPNRQTTRPWELSLASQP